MDSYTDTTVDKQNQLMRTLKHIVSDFQTTIQDNAALEMIV